MAKYSVAPATVTGAFTTAALANGASATDNNHLSTRCTSASSLRIEEVYIGGEATTSTVVRMALRRISTAGATWTDIAPAKLQPLSAAAVSQGYAIAGTDPVIASTSPMLALGFNAFGGVVRWVAAPGEEIFATTATAPNGELNLSAVSGVALISAHLVFEEL
jgi:hypothetical protein